MVPRSYLYVPGDDPAKLAGAGRRGADAVIIDLEDAVAAGRKEPARDHAASFVAGLSAAADAGRAADARHVVDAGRAAEAWPAAGQVWVRVNQPPAMSADLDAVVAAGLAGVVVPKAEPDVLAEADRLLTAAETRQGLPTGRIGVIALIETAAGLLAAAEVARAPRVVRLGLGEADLIAELGLLPSADRSELISLRLRLVVASAAAAIAAPVGPVETALTDDERLRTSTSALRRLGFGARTALHPRQLPVINATFTPSDEEVAQARQTVAALAAADAGGSAVAVTAQGQFVDPAVVRSAYRTLAIHESLMRHNEPTRRPRTPATGADAGTGAAATTTTSGDDPGSGDDQS